MLNVIYILRSSLITQDLMAVQRHAFRNNVNVNIPSFGNVFTFFSLLFLFYSVRKNTNICVWIVHEFAIIMNENYIGAQVLYHASERYIYQEISFTLIFYLFTSFLFIFE